jgi:ATP-dependent Clp protease protease subunit
MSIYGENNNTPVTNIVTDQLPDMYAEISNQLTNRVDILNSVVFIEGEINNTTLMSFIMRVRAILATREETDKSPINLLLNSPGGDVYEMFGIIDYIESLDVPVNIICRGRAMSAAAVILACGTGTRMISKRSTVMFHQASTDIYGKASDMNSYLKNLNKLEQEVNNLLASKTKKDAKWWAENTMNDLYLMPDQLLEYGIIDEII